MRIDGADTVQASASQRNNPDPNGVQPKTYQYATPDGRFVYFTSGEKLTNNSQAEPGVPDLYRYDVDSGGLVDLTAADPDGAGVQGVLGVSDNGNRVYFAATGALAPGATDNGPEPLRARRRHDDVHHGSRPKASPATPRTGRRDDAKLSRVTPSGGPAVRLPRMSSSATTTPGSWSSTSTTCRRRVRLRLLPSGRTARRPRTRILAHRRGSDLAQRDSTLPAPEPLRRRDDGVLHQPERLRPDDTNGKYDAYMWEDGASSCVSTGSSANRVLVRRRLGERQRRVLPDPRAAGRDRHRQLGRPLRRAGRRRPGHPEPAPAAATVPGRGLQAAGDPADRPAAQRHHRGR